MTAPTATSQTIHQLRNHDGPLYIANKTAAKLTCHERVGDKRVDFELDPAGQPDSVMIMPKLALDVRGIQKLWMRGDIAISTDEATEDQIAELINQGMQAPEQRISEILGHDEKTTVEVTPSSAHNALVEKACLECGRVNPETKTVDRGRVIQSQRELTEGVPPLCGTHKGLAGQFIPRPATDSQGNNIWEFDKVSLGSAVRGPQQ